MCIVHVTIEMQYSDHFNITASTTRLSVLIFTSVYYVSIREQNMSRGNLTE